MGKKKYVNTLNSRAAKYYSNCSLVGISKYFFLLLDCTLKFKMVKTAIQYTKVYPKET